MSSVARRTEKALRVVCSRMNEEVQELTNQGIAKAAAWFQLFKAWDEDGTGSICYEEFHEIVRRWGWPSSSCGREHRSQPRPSSPHLASGTWP